MFAEKEAMRLRIANLIFYLVMVISATIFDYLPLNHARINDVFAFFDTPITAPDFTFSLWNLVYVAFLFFIIYQFGGLHGSAKGDNPDLVYGAGLYFIFAAGSGTAWLFSFHYRNTIVCLLLIFFTWFCLQRACYEIRKEVKHTRERIFFLLPFSLYYAWASYLVTTNIVILFTQSRKDLLGFPYSLLCYVCILVWLVTASYQLIRYQDYVYAGVSIFINFGIFYKNFQIVGEERAFTIVILTTVSTGILFIISGVIYLVRRDKPKLPDSSGHWIFYD